MKWISHNKFNCGLEIHIIINFSFLLLYFRFCFITIHARTAHFFELMKKIHFWSMLNSIHDFITLKFWFFHYFFLFTDYCVCIKCNFRVFTFISSSIFFNEIFLWFPSTKEWYRVCVCMTNHSFFSSSTMKSKCQTIR